MQLCYFSIEFSKESKMMNEHFSMEFDDMILQYDINNVSEQQSNDVIIS